MHICGFQILEEDFYFHGVAIQVNKLCGTISIHSISLILSAYNGGINNSKTDLWATKNWLVNALILCDIE